MTVEEAVVDKLLATGAVTALVGTRVTQLIVPQSSLYPAVCVRKISHRRRYHLRGKDRLSDPLIQIDAYVKIGSDDAHLTATTISDAVEDAITIEGWSMGSPPRDVVAAFLTEERQTYESEEFRLVRVMRDYRIHTYDPVM